ncbi:hypothetical protein AJ87_48680 [Rhizobium yanglingense]|nr:hypothetical protein AJ87_48680 [Rhizobium yanglingense]
MVRDLVLDGRVQSSAACSLATAHYRRNGGRPCLRLHVEGRLPSSADAIGAALQFASVCSASRPSGRRRNTSEMRGIPLFAGTMRVLESFFWFDLAHDT